MELIAEISAVCHIILQLLIFFVIWHIFYSFQRDKKAFFAAGFLSIANILIGLVIDAPSGIRYLFSATFVLFYSFVRYKKNWEKTIFLLLLFYNYHALSFLISSSIYQCVIKAMMNRLEIQSKDYLSKMYQTVLWGQMILLLAYTLCFLFMVGILKKIVKKPVVMKWQEIVFLSTLNIVGGMLVRIVLEISMVKVGEEVFLLFEEKPELIWKVPMIAILIYIGEIFIIYIYQQYVKLQKEQQRHFIEEQQMKAMQRRLEEAENFYGSVRKVRHDMRNHMSNIKGLAASGKYEMVEHYIEKLDETIQTLEYKFVTGNAVTDVVINDKYHKAVNAGILFQVRFYYKHTDTISVFDIGIILDNLLDNAIEACQRLEEKQKFINLTLKRNNNFLLIEVENNFDGILRLDESKEFLLTRKQSSLPNFLLEHGIGLKNVKEIAERYLGDLDIQINGKVFRVLVMLQQIKDR